MELFILCLIVFVVVAFAINCKPATMISIAVGGLVALVLFK